MKKNKKSILFISNGYGLSDSISGGESRLYNIMRFMIKKFDVSMLTTEGGFLSVSKNLPKTKITLIKCSSAFFVKKEIFSFQRLLGYFTSAFSGYNSIKKLKFNLIYTSSDYFCDAIPAFLYKKKYPVTKWFAMIHHLHLPPSKRPGNYIHNLILYLIQQFSFKLIALKADMVNLLDTPLSGQIESNIKKYGFSGKINLVKNGISKIIKPLSFKKDRCLAVYVGGLRPAKGLYDIVPVWKEVVKHGRYRLIIAGKLSAENHSYLSREIKKYLLENSIAITGFIPSGKLDLLMKKASVYFFPSREEGWGISVLDALNYGLQPVVYDLPAYSSFKNRLKASPCFDINTITGLTLRAFRQFKVKDNSKFLKDFLWARIAEKEFNEIKNLLQS